MTKLLEKALSKMATLPEAEQDLIASWLLTELESERAFDRALEATAPKLAGLADAALREDDAGLTTRLDPDRL